MIRLAFRLTLAGGREALTRLVIIAFAIALGVGMLLTTLAAIHATTAQNDRYAWLETGADFVPDRPKPGIDPAWWKLSGDEFGGRVIGRVDVAATGPHAPTPPGMSALPRSGEFFASPALAQLLRTTPQDQLANRFPGHLAGTIGRAALPSPDALIVVIGHRPAELAHDPHAREVHSISTIGPGSCKLGCYSIGIDADGIKLVLAVVAAALLFPILIFIGAATRLSAARREQRFAAMRLVGATPRQIATVAGVESAVASSAGCALGFSLFFILRPVLADLPFTGVRPYPEDLTLHAIDIVSVAIGVPVAAVLAARLALRRVTVSPLGVSRKTTPPPPRAWRVLPLLAGLAELAWFVHAGRPTSTDGQIGAYFTGVLVTMAGLVFAGPWLTFATSRLLGRWTARPAVLLASRRLGDDPRAGFRAVSGVVLALFVASIGVGIMATIRAQDSVPTHGGSARYTLLERLTISVRAGATIGDSATLPPVLPRLVHQLMAVPAVRGVTLVHGDPRTPDPFVGLVRCADLPRTPALGRCPAGADAARIIVADATRFHQGQPALTVVAARELAGSPVTTVVVDARRSGGVERARTILERAFPYRAAPATITEEEEQLPSVQKLNEYQQLANVVIVASLIIAGCSLAVSVSGGLVERKRPFALLRLAGVPLGVLRRVVTLESCAPLIALAATSATTGFLAAGLFVRSQLSATLHGPGPAYYLSAAAGLSLALAVITSCLPLLARITGPESARND